MKKFAIIILAIQFILSANCKTTKKPVNKNMNYEELALKYFVDSVYNSKTYNLKGKKLFYNGLVTGRSKYYYDPFIVLGFHEYFDALRFKKSYLNNNAKDFYIKVPVEIKKISFDGFKKSKNSNDYFLKIKHYIKSRKKILVLINIIDEEEEIPYKIYIFLDLKGSLRETEVEAQIFMAPRE